MADALELIVGDRILVWELCTWSDDSNVRWGFGVLSTSRDHIVVRAVGRLNELERKVRSPHLSRVSLAAHPRCAMGCNKI
jgi:hypothetical protein